MATDLIFYSDASLTTPVTNLTINQLADGTTGDVDKLVYLGDPVGGSTYQANSDPGNDPITVNIVDAFPAQDVEASNIKLALTSGGLGSAVAGDPLSLGVTLTSGVGNLVEVYIRSDTPILAASNSDITIETNELIQT